VTPILELAGVAKGYGALRPLRIRELVVAEGESVALVGLDRPAAEVLVNLITGTTLPDEGRIAVFGRSTAEIRDSADWLTVVDRFGIVSARAVLLEPLSTLQNMAMPFTLEIEPIATDARDRAAALAREVGVPESLWQTAIASLDALTKLHVRAARALALDPRILVLEHASAGLASDDVMRTGHELRAVAERRGAAIVAITADDAFAQAVARRVLRWEPATGRLAEGRGWFRARSR